MSGHLTMPKKNKKASKKPSEQGVLEVAGEEEEEPAEEASQAVQDGAAAAPEAVPEGGATGKLGKENAVAAAATIKGALPAFSLSEVPAHAPCVFLWFPAPA